MGRRALIATGAAGGLLGGAVIWIYEAVVWAGIQHLMPLAAIPANAVGLSLGPAWQALPESGVLGTAIHFGFAMAWGAAFALVWPSLRRTGIEATLAALLLAPVLWVVMHAAIIFAGHHHPDYADPAVVIGGVFSHLFYTVPMALWVRHRAAL